MGYKNISNVFDAVQEYKVHHFIKKKETTPEVFHIL